MAKLSTLSLEELYERTPRTAGVISAIVEKSDFSKINEKYCSEVCGLKCKNFKNIDLVINPVDILIIQDHRNPPGRFDRKPGQQDEIIDNVITTICKDAGYNSSKITFRLVSLLKCPAESEDFVGGKPPAVTTLQKCYPYLDHEIKISKPKVIISLGTATTKALGFIHASNTSNRGEILLGEHCPIVLTIHPKTLTYIRQNARGGGGLWGPDYYKIVQRDFEKALKIATGEVSLNKDTLPNTVKELLSSGRLKIAKNIGDVAEYIAEINALPPKLVISFDTETTSVDPLDPNLKLLSIQFGWKQPNGVTVARVIPLYHRENTAYNGDDAWILVKPILENPDRPKVGHNSKYDILVIFWSMGVRVKGVIFDTLLIQHSIESGIQGCYGLKTMCWDYLFHLGFAGYEEALGSLASLRSSEKVN